MRCKNSEKATRRAKSLEKLLTNNNTSTLYSIFSPIFAFSIFFLTLALLINEVLSETLRRLYWYGLGDDDNTAP